ncbi:hypothetical protein ABZ942_05305 [Nocardia sp. NPDC046473]|uniref:hypothetical protein n=1 Tax=Nocardia sp. NPDC046473 TaxID=3155733 RepID=UPI0033E98B8E
MQHKIAHGGNTLVPAILALAAAGFRMTEQGALLVATGTYVADDPVALVGLVKLVELRGWSWQANDEEVDTRLARFRWTG